MADLTDVENALVSLIATAVYPNGTGQASAAAGLNCAIYAGWPTPNDLDADLAAATPRQHVTVFSSPQERNTTRYNRDWQPVAVATATLTLSASGQVITVGGAMPSPFAAHNLVVEANGQAFAYAVQQSDTLTSIATGLAALIVAKIAGTTSSGPAITLPNNAKITAARVGTIGTIGQEIGRSEKVFQISVWSDSPAHRSAVAQLVDAALRYQSFLTMPDSTAARIIYRSSLNSDEAQKARIYRRDLFYTVEFALLYTAPAWQVEVGQINESWQSTDSGGNTVSTPAGTIYF